MRFSPFIRASPTIPTRQPVAALANFGYKEQVCTVHNTVVLRGGSFESPLAGPVTTFERSTTRGATHYFYRRKFLVRKCLLSPVRRSKAPVGQGRYSSTVLRRQFSSPRASINVIIPVHLRCLWGAVHLTHPPSLRIVDPSEFPRCSARQAKILFRIYSSLPSDICAPWP